MSKSDLIILLIFTFSFMFSGFVLLFLEDIVNWYIFKTKKDKKGGRKWINYNVEFVGKL